MQIRSTTLSLPAQAGTGSRSVVKNLHATGCLAAQQRAALGNAVASTSSGGKRVTRKIQNFVSHFPGDMQFSVDQDSRDNVLKVTGKAQQNVLMQLPSKEASEIAKAFDKFQETFAKQASLTPEFSNIGG